MQSTKAQQFNDLRKDIGRRIANLRLDRGLTLKILSNKSGISERKLSAYEIGKAQIHLEMLTNLIPYLKCDLRDFFMK